MVKEVLEQLGGAEISHGDSEQHEHYRYGKGRKPE
jgi:hypothetical protein